MLIKRKHILGNQRQMPHRGTENRKNPSKANGIRAKSEWTVCSTSQNNRKNWNRPKIEWCKVTKNTGIKVVITFPMKRPGFSCCCSAFLVNLLSDIECKWNGSGTLLFDEKKWSQNVSMYVYISNENGLKLGTPVMQSHQFCI